MAARLAVTVQVMDRHTPVDATFAEAIVADGHKFLNDGRVFLYIITDAVGAPHLITIQMPTSSDVDGLVVDDLTYDLPDNQNVFMGPFLQASITRRMGWCTLIGKALMPA